jgi:RNA polymerase sigma-70 factor (ECF subfamily)
VTSSDSSPDGTLIDAVLGGDREQFAVLVGRYQTALLRMAESRLGRRDWAEDVVQETFLCAFKSLHTYDSQFSFRTWLWTIALNQCRRHHQRRARTPHVHTWSEAGADAGDQAKRDCLECAQATPHDSLLAKERSQQLHALLAELPEEQADALRLRFFGELKFQEIADAMHCSLSSAKNRVRWGLLKMSQMLNHAEREQPLAGDVP